jgi:molybdopterin/thiamine biosynthesis adenylyltransferase/rhodanese-related sulfurtransferase
MLSAEEQERYSRHLKLPGFGPERQEALKASRVLLVGAGGLGCPTALYLAAAGVGTLGIVDPDRVDVSNLQRQVAHTTSRVGQLKTDSLIETLTALNPLLTYQAHPMALTAENVTGLIAAYDLVIDGTDNFATRFLMADACYLGHKPLLTGAVHQFAAQIALFNGSPCYRCLFQAPPTQNALAACADVGILGVVPGTVGLMLATEAMKFLTDLPTPSQGALLQYNALQQTLRSMPIEADPACPLCSSQSTIHQVKAMAATCASVPTGLEVTEIPAGVALIDVREADEWAQGHIPGATHFALSRLQAGENLALDGPTVLYCQRGRRSLIALQLLNHPPQVFSLAGGYAEWLRRYPLVQAE